jgi:hypothetical protein
MLGMAGQAFAYLTATSLLRTLTAHAAELMASVPIELGPTLRQDPGLGKAEMRGRGTRLFKPPRLLQVQLVLRVA